MDILEQIIENLTSDEVRRFKILSNRFKADEEKKLIVLFDAIRAGNYGAVEEEMVTTFYGDISHNSRNNYYRLRNKLLNNLEKSLLFYHFNYKNTLEAYSTLQLALLLEERGLYKETYYYLKKAEKVAQKYDQFNILEVIYDEMIRLASKDVEMEVEAILKNRKANFTKIEMTRLTSEVLGVISQQLKKRNFSRNTKKTDSVIALLEETKARLESHKEIFQSPSGKILIFRTVSAILQQKAAYPELNKYVKETFDDFEENKLFSKENHSTRLLMRIWRINCLWIMLKIKEAKTEIDALEEELGMYKRQNFNEYALYFYTSKVNNQKMRGDLEGAAHSLKEAMQIKEITQSSLNELILMVSLADQYFCQHLYSHALEVLNRINMHVKYEKLDEEIRFYLIIFEMVVCYESHNYGLADSLHQKLKTQFKSLLKDENYDKASRFVEIILRMNQAALEGKKTFLKSAHKNFLTDFPPSEISSNQIIFYELYLQGLTENKSYYSLFCSYVASEGKEK